MMLSFSWGADLSTHGMRLQVVRVCLKLFAQAMERRDLRFPSAILRAYRARTSSSGAPSVVCPCWKQGTRS